MKAAKPHQRVVAMPPCVARNNIETPAFAGVFTCRMVRGENRLLAKCPFSL